MARLGIQERDLHIKYILGSGSGGQKINKTHSTVYIKHLPTGLEVKCGKNRLRTLNKYHALSSLCEKLEKQLLGERTKKEQLAAKVRRQKKRRSRRTQEKILQEKRQISEKKKFRRSPSEE